MADYVNVIVGLLLLFLSYYQECAGESADNVNGTVDLPENSTSGDSNDRNGGVDIAMVAAISGGSAALGLVTVLLAMALFGICSRKCKKGRYTFDQTQPIQRATSRKRSMKSSLNGSTVVNKSHNYETVLPNLSKNTAVKEARMYEVPLSKSETLTRSGQEHEDVFQGSWEEDGYMTQEPTYMNLKTTAPTRNPDFSIVPQTYWGSHRDRFDPERERSESVAI